MNVSVFSSLSVQAQQALAKLSSALQGVVPVAEKSWTIPVSDLPSEGDDLALLAEVKEWAGKSKLCLYYFECIDPSVDLNTVEKAFSDAKAHESNNRAYARLNKMNSRFYVGSSQTVAKRVAEHLGYGASGTYALQLLHWARPLSLNLRFVCAKYSEDVQYSIIQSLEDTFWESQTPMFGRQGRK